MDLWPYPSRGVRGTLKWDPDREVRIMMWYSGNGAQWWEWLTGAFVMLAFWGAIVWAVWYSIASTRRGNNRELERLSSPAGRVGNDSKRILDERLARGEIDAEEYQRLRE